MRVLLKPRSSAFKALSSAALLLPGLADQGVLAADSDSASIQYSRYREGERNLFDVDNTRDPLQVDTLHLRGDLGLADRLRFGFDYIEDVWSGATPVATAPLAAQPNRPIRKNQGGSTIMVGASPLLTGQALLDPDLNPLRRTPSQGQQLERESRLVHVLVSASPEVRRQGNFKLSYELDDAGIDFSGGLSLERDFESAFGGISGHWDFNQKLTTLKGGISYTDSDISAVLDHDSAPYITKIDHQDKIRFQAGSEILQASRRDWAASLGLTQIVNKNALIDLNLGYSYSSGFLENPYKAVTVLFIDPKTLGDSVLVANRQALLEQRPGHRNQWTVGGKLVHFLPPLEAALHLGYQFSSDDWGVRSHTFDAQWIQPLGGGWNVAPRIRYYSQSAADFYRPFLISPQNFSEVEVDDRGREVWIDGQGNEFFRNENFDLVDASGNPVDETTIDARPKTRKFDRKKLPDHFSSDHRLSGFGTLSGGITLSKAFARGVTLEAGFDFYRHAGSLKLGGGGENAFADFNYYVFNGAIRVDLETFNQEFLRPGGAHSSHGHLHHGAPAPAGVRFAHLMPEGKFMVGYRFGWRRRNGPAKLLHGSNTANDLEVVAKGCRQIGCRFAPTYMDMRMHMVEIMYGPADWLTLMLMPQFVAMDMNLRELEGRPPPSPEVHEHTGIQGHSTGGVGDTIVAALVKLFEVPGHHIHLGLAVSAPTGEVDLEFRRTGQQDGGLVHFGMQLGSGTWDLLPSLTYTGNKDRWNWGAQLNGTLRLEDRNDSGYRLGNVFQATWWGGYGLTDWLHLSARGIFTAEGKNVGDFDRFNGRSGPMDFPFNYGGRFWDAGFGIDLARSRGLLAGHTLRFEWLQPVRDDVNGFQLKREGALSVAWSYTF